VFQLFKNNAKSTLSTAISSAATASLVLQTGHGARFPTPLAPDFYMVTMDDGTNVEVCKVVAISTDTLTVLRGQENTTAQTNFATGTRVELRLTADSLQFAQYNKMFRQHVLPSFNTTSFQLMGTALPTFAGATQAAVTLSNSSARTMANRTRFTSALSGNAPVKLFSPNFQATMQAGFRFLTMFGFEFMPNSGNFFVGLVNTTGAMNSVHPPSSLISGIAVGQATSGGFGREMSIWRNDGAGAAVQLSLGSFFAVQSGAWYMFELSAAPAAARVDYRVRRLDISSIADAASFFTTDIPPNSAMLAPALYASTLTDSIVSIDYGGWIVDT
jgi:hypothetical protein